MLDVLIVGAGFGGLYALHKLRGMGLKALVLEAAPSVGGTWWANRYPGARVDIQSLEYSYSFSEPLQQQWHWSERYASQPELLRYANHVADRFDLRRDIRLNTRVAAAHFDDAAALWRVRSDDGRALHCTLRRDGDRAAVDAQHAGVRWPRDVSRARSCIRPRGRTSRWTSAAATSRWWAPGRRRCS